MVKRVNFNAVDALYDDLLRAQRLLGRSQSSILRQALAEFLARAIPAESLARSNVDILQQEALRPSEDGITVQPPAFNAGSDDSVDYVAEFSKVGVSKTIEHTDPPEDDVEDVPEHLL
jgi:hypothetical protein